MPAEPASLREIPRYDKCIRLARNKPPKEVITHGPSLRLACPIPLLCKALKVVRVCSIPDLDSGFEKCDYWAVLGGHGALLEA